ncbi:MAG: hypothetical protein WCJ35_03435 [Planctomycetota bacterium]
MNKPIPAPWTHVRRCPCCHKSGCLVSSLTDPSAVICRRVVSPEPVGDLGWLHELISGPAWSPWRTSLPRLAKGTAK